MKFKLFMAVCFCSVSAFAGQKLSDSQVKQEIIRESIENYPGNCACPYNHASNGSRCGGRSAYSRSGGYSVICYAKDVTVDMIEQWKRQHQKN